MSFEECMFPPPRSSRRNRRVQMATACIPRKLVLDKQYHAVSYKEIMSVQNRYDRMALYERAFELCIRADTNLSAWTKRGKQKQAPEDPTRCMQLYRARQTSQDSLSSSTFRKKASLSILLRKASFTRSSALPPILQDTPKSSASRFITTSFSRISSSMSRSRRSSSSGSSSSSEASSSNDRQPEPTASKIKRRLARQPSTPRRPFIIHPHINDPVDTSGHQIPNPSSTLPRTVRHSMLAASRPPIAIRV